MVDAEQRLRSAVTRQLLAGNDTVDGGVLRYFGLEPGGDVVVVVLNGSGPVLAAEQRLGRTLTETGPFLMTSAGAEIVIVLPAAGSRQRIRMAIEQSGMAAGGGVSRVVRGPGIATGLRQARTAAQSSDADLTDFDDLGALSLLLDRRDPHELGVLASELDPLGAGDDDLVTTLATYLRRSGQVEAAATDLGIHRHTMRHRVQRIRELLDDDLNSADSRTRLWLAVKARQLLSGRRLPAEADRRDS
ncbi:hypothetical protein ACNUDN_01794 [Mycobacterium sp. smrl_JER01]